MIEEAEEFLNKYRKDQNKMGKFKVSICSNTKEGLYKSLKFLLNTIDSGEFDDSKNYSIALNHSSNLIHTNIDYEEVDSNN